jgi:hypothetical protein
MNMRNGPGKTRWCAIVLFSVILIGILCSECNAQSPDPIILIQGVEMSRLQSPPARLHLHIFFRDPLRKSESDNVMEFDGDKRKLVALTPQDPGAFYDGSQACLYLPSVQQASFRDIHDTTAEFLFDPRTLGLNSGLGWSPTVSGLLPYKNGKVDMVGAEQIRGINTWHVRISLNKPINYQIDIWIGDTEGFPVYRYDMKLDKERRSIISFYENQNYPWLPNRVDSSSFNTNGSLRHELAVTLSKIETNVLFLETTWTLAGLNLPVGTQVMDRRTELTIGYWNGTNVTPFEVWATNQLAKNDVPILPKHSRIMVWILLCATTLIPLFFLWKCMSENKKL